MSFLMFAYRKLALKRQISDKEYRSIVISQQKQTMTEQVGVFQQSISAAKNSVSAAANATMSMIAQAAYSPFIKDGKVDCSSAEAQAKLAGVQADLQAQNYAVMQASSATNSIFEASSQAKMSGLKAIEGMLDSEMANIESQLKQIREEVASVEKGETEAAKSEAPKFGLA